MAKKTKSGKKKHSLQAGPSQFDRMFASAVFLLEKEDYKGAVDICESLLSYLPQRSPRRIDVLNALGGAQGALQNFPEAFAAFSEALDLDPLNADLWYNRGQASRFTMRAGQSYKDFLRAQELNKDSQLFQKIEQDLVFSHKIMQESLKMRGEDFTLEQLVEQENHFQRGLTLLGAQRWKEAEEEFRATIALGDCLPQPWGNLGSCLMMQRRFDEAEEAWKRALVIDHTYDLAQQNLKLLPEIRKNGLPQHFAMRDPMKEVKIKQTITFRKE